MTARRTVVLGGTTLAGRELVEKARGVGLSADRMTLVDPGAETAVLAAVADELVLSTPRLEEALEEAELVFGCVRLSDDDRRLVQAASERIPVVDLTGTLDGAAFDAREGVRVKDLGPGIHASPAGSSLLVAALARSAQVAGAAGPAFAVVLEPASELGQEALDELFAQAVALLSFTSMPTSVLGGQAVADVSSPGPGGAHAESRLRREVRQLLRQEPGAESVSLLVARPGTFHGVAVAMRAHVDKEAWMRAARLERRLIIGDADMRCTPVGAVQEENAIIGRFEPDGLGGTWAWAAADTLAQGAVGNAVELLASSRSPKALHG